MNYYSCTNCNSKIEIEWDFCENCRAEIIKCKICFTPFNKEDLAYQCPFCRSLFHTDHLEQWYKINEYCPHCKKVEKISDFIKISLSSFREYRFDLDKDGKIDPSLLTQMNFQGGFWQSQKLILEKFEQKISSVEKKFYVASPPGSGKTIVGLEIAKRIAKNTLVLTPNFSTQEQWIDKIKLFLNKESNIINTMIGANDPKSSAPITVMTYQRFSVYSQDEEMLIHFAEQMWLKDINEDDKEFIESLKKNNYEEYSIRLNEYINKIRHKIIKGDFTFSDIKIRDILHKNTLEIIDTLKNKGIGLIILDECHHLTSIWAYIVNYLIKEFNSPFILGLTATPPIDMNTESEEVGIYELLFGTVDIEIPTPAAVKQKNIAPYQDLLYLTYPQEDEIREIEEEFKPLRKLFSSFKYRDLKGPLEFLKEEYKNNQLNTLKKYKNDDLLNKINQLFEEQEEIDQEIFTLNELFIILHSYYWNYVKKQENFNSKKTLDYYNKLERFFEKFVNVEDLIKEKEKTFRFLNSSKSRLNAVVDILEHEFLHLKEKLRSVVIYDFSAENLSLNILEKLISNSTTNQLDPVSISSSSIFTDKDIANQILKESERWKENFKFDIKLSIKETENNKIVQIEGNGLDWRTGIYTLLFTYLLEKGITKCLIGPRNILGEGWDSVKLNTLVDLTSVSAYQTVIQTKGRAYRVDETDYLKISNIWDIAVIDPSLPFGLSTFYNIQRKHEHFYGLSEDGIIEKGIGHIYPSIYEDISEIAKDISKFNKIMINKALQREKTYNQWKIGEKYDNVELLSYDLKFEDRNFIIPVVNDAYGVIRYKNYGKRFSRKGYIDFEEKLITDLLSNAFQSLILLNEYKISQEKKNETLSLISDEIKNATFSQRMGNYYRLLLPSINPKVESVLDTMLMLQNANIGISIKELTENGTIIKNSNKIEETMLKQLIVFGFSFLKTEEINQLLVIWNRVVALGEIIKEEIVQEKERHKRIFKVNKKIIWM
ncbi:MAG: DEAD/DEAH box helicase family protein [Candidatus Heimdallarchaeum endolithica]|uniref:DEAD/DEAH box helicase family protein n=1 Tax=Candidatus Heimdallarchaeum endolithica TaxID=2876572 RepID=A0A9Y1FNT2_9ARCH|nr:MAG: DEAD/DEAH box helicase family protein [Candidatus Heimdallarchaeum endolithica]